MKSKFNMGDDVLVVSKNSKLADIFLFMPGIILSVHKPHPGCRKYDGTIPPIIYKIMIGEKGNKQVTERLERQIFNSREEAEEAIRNITPTSETRNIIELPLLYRLTSVRERYNKLLDDEDEE